MNDQQFKEIVKQSIEIGTPLDWSYTGDARYKKVVAEIMQGRQAASVTVIELEPPTEHPSTQETMQQEPAQDDAGISDIPSLIQTEKEPDEVRQYEIQRTEYWEKYWEKRKIHLPSVPNSQELKKLIWNDVDNDVAEFKKGLYQIIGADRKPSSDTVLIFRSEEDANLIRELGFDTAAAIKGSGTIPFQVAVTMLKMKYKRVL